MTNIPVFYAQSGQLVRWRRGTPGALAVNAGVDISVTAGANVTLRGSASGGSGTYTYSWTQTAGPVVILTSPSSATTTFTAPSKSSVSICTFKLTVNDGLTSANDSVSVTVASSAGWRFTQRFPGDPRTSSSKKFYFGATCNGGQTVAQHESAGGAKFGIHRSFLTNAATPNGIKPKNGQLFNIVTDDHANNRLPLISFRYGFSNWQDASTGAHDDAWDALIGELETNYSKPVWLSINHEPENDWKQQSTLTQAQWQTTYAPYWRAMQQRFRARLDAWVAAHGALKVIAFCPVVMGFSFASSQYSAQTNWWVDNTFDFLGVDIYGATTGTTITSTTQWTNLMKFVANKAVPYVIAEWGYQHSDTNEATKITNFYNTNCDGSHDCLGLAYFDSNANTTNNQWILYNNDTYQNGNALDTWNGLLAGTASIHMSNLGY